MEEHEFDVQVCLDFKHLTCEEIVKLERYLHSGLEGREWGPAHIVIKAEVSGYRSAVDKKKKISKEDLLELEKKGAKK